MWVSRRKIKKMEKRISDLEAAQSVNTFTFGKVDLKGLARIIEEEYLKQAGKKKPTRFNG